MRRKDKAITDPHIIEEIMLKADICHLAMSADHPCFPH